MTEDELKSDIKEILEYTQHKNNCQLNIQVLENPCDDCKNVVVGCYDRCHKPDYFQKEDCWNICPDHIPDCYENCDEVSTFCEAEGKIVCSCGLDKYKRKYDV
jgi:hypothetical protein